MSACTTNRAPHLRVQFPTDRLSVAVIAGCYLIGFAIVSSALRVQYGFPLDDSYIHQTIARNFARTGVVGFHSGVPSPGSTSILWTCVQAANFVLLHLNPVTFNLLVSAALLPIIGMLLFALASRDRLPTKTRLALAAGPAFSGNFVWLGMIGMEHLLFAALTLAAVLFWYRDGSRSALAAGAMLGFVTLTRPEALVFGLVLLLDARGAKRTSREVTLAALPWLAGIAANSPPIFTHPGGCSREPSTDDPGPTFTPPEVRTRFLPSFNFLRTGLSDPSWRFPCGLTGGLAWSSFFL